MAAEHRSRRIPAWLIGVLSAAIVLVAGILTDDVHFGVAIGWIVCAGLVALVVTRFVHKVAPVDEGAGLAVGYDALPMLLLAAWIVTIAALLTRHWMLAAIGGVLCLYHAAIVVPRMIAARVPRWAKHAPTLDIIVANVFIDNETPEAAARQLVAASADVVIIVESTPSFMTVFDSVGGNDTYPYRVNDPDDHSDYAVTVVCKREPGKRSQMKTIGPLKLAIAEVDVDGIATLVVALNPMATVDPGGHETWKEQIEALEELVPTLSGPVVIAGDLNTTRYRPEFEELLALGLHDAIDALGKGLNPSFKLGAEGVLSSVGAVARLDHALVNDCVFPLSVENLEACGSDHLPFELRVAVREAAAASKDQ